MEDKKVNSDYCSWKQDLPNVWEDDSWNTNCGDKFILIEGSPKENNFNFCPNCGRRIKED